MRRVSRLVVVGLVLSLAVAGSLALDADQPPAAAQVDATTTATAQEFDSTTFVITTDENGTATFTIRYERRLANETERERFETYAERFENQSTDLYANFQSRADSLTAAGRNATGRDMQAANFRRDARVEERFNTLGVLELTFQWTAFGVVRDDGRVVVGDVFDGGIYLAPNQALVFQAGDGLRFASVDPDSAPSGDSLAASDSVTWQGERDFSDERPRVTFEPASTPAPTTSDTTTNDGAGTIGDGDDGGTTAPGDASGDGLGMLPMIALALVVALAAAFAYREYGDGLVTDDDDTAGGATPDPTAHTAPPDQDTGGTASAGANASASEPAVSEEELLTDEDRVVSLLEDHGGRMRQVNIVDETGWSKSKVSMLLSDMEDDGVISKLRVGRENIVSLDGHEPDVAGSPFDDDTE